MVKDLLVVSTYPPKGSLHGNKFSAVAHYTKSTLISMGKDFSFKVLADKLSGEDSLYQEANVKVLRCWQRGSSFLLLDILKEILASRQKKILFCFEWGMFGRNLVGITLLPLFFVVLRVLGKEIFFVSHGVLLDYEKVAPQLGDKTKSLKVRFGSLGLKILYFFIILCSKKVVVFEEYLRQELLCLFNKPEKVVTIPHGVDEPEKVYQKEEAREKLGIDNEEFVLLCFGFLIWYKGSDWLVEKMAEHFKKNPSSKILLMMVGGESQVHKDDPVYRKYLEEIYNRIKEAGGKILLTGFIKEEEIGLYFSSADLAVLPYRVLVSASGPLSLVFSYKKPFLVSDNLKGYALNKDFEGSQKKSDLNFEDISFSLQNEKVINKMESFAENQKLLNKIEEFSGSLYQKRKWSVTGKRYQELFQ